MSSDTTDRSATLVKKYQPVLSARLEELEGRLRLIEHELDQPAPKDDEERATEREGDEVQEDLGRAGLDEIRAIRAAFGRIDAGEFGYCVSCGGEISEARLDIVPHAARCRNCA